MTDDVAEYRLKPVRDGSSTTGWELLRVSTFLDAELIEHVGFFRTRRDAVGYTIRSRQGPAQ